MPNKVPDWMLSYLSQRSPNDDITPHSVSLACKKKLGATRVAINKATQNGLIERVNWKFGKLKTLWQRTGLLRPSPKYTRNINHVLSLKRGNLFTRNDLFDYMPSTTSHYVLARCQRLGAVKAVGYQPKMDTTYRLR